MARRPLGVHVCGIDEVATVVEVIIEDYFGILHVGAKAKYVATEAERIYRELGSWKCDHN